MPWIPATIAAAAERWPPPVSEERIRIFGAFGFIKTCLSSNRDSIGLWFSLRAQISTSLLHLALDLLDLNQVLRIERQRRVIAIGFMAAEATIRRLFTPRFHRVGQPQTLKVPIVIAQVANRRQVLARRQSAFIVDHRAGSARITS